jgi:hypothetical protein
VGTDCTIAAIIAIKNIISININTSLSQITKQVNYIMKIISYYMMIFHYKDEEIEIKLVQFCHYKNHLKPDAGGSHL